MKSKLPPRAEGFPMDGMDYQDRLQLTIKDYGRKVVIRLNRGVEVECSDDMRTITIMYPDSPTRKVKSPEP
jgi:hypothetical protein